MSKEILDKYIEIWSNGNYEDLDSVVAENIKRKGPATTNHSVDSREGLLAVMKHFRTAFPDGKVTTHNDHYLGDIAFCEWTFTGTNTGDGDFPPTGRSVDVPGMSYFRFEDGKIIEETLVYDVLGMMVQLGLAEPPAAAASA